MFPDSVPVHPRYSAWNWELHLPLPTQYRYTFYRQNHRRLPRVQADHLRVPAEPKIPGTRYCSVKNPPGRTESQPSYRPRFSPVLLQAAFSVQDYNCIDRWIMDCKE